MIIKLLGNLGIAVHQKYQKASNNGKEYFQYIHPLEVLYPDKIKNSYKSIKMTGTLNNNNNNKTGQKI